MCKGIHTYIHRQAISRSLFLCDVCVYLQCAHVYTHAYMQVAARGRLGDPLCVFYVHMHVYIHAGTGPGSWFRSFFCLLCSCANAYIHTRTVTQQLTYLYCRTFRNCTCISQTRHWIPSFTGKAATRVAILARHPRTQTIRRYCCGYALARSCARSLNMTFSLIKWSESHDSLYQSRHQMYKHIQCMRIFEKQTNVAKCIRTVPYRCSCAQTWFAWLFHLAHSVLFAACYLHVV